MWVYFHDNQKIHFGGVKSKLKSKTVVSEVSISLARACRKMIRVFCFLVLFFSFGKGLHFTWD